jgi:hypothetical protein
MYRPLTRMDLPVGVFLFANNSMSLIRVILPDPAGPTMLTASPVIMAIRSTASIEASLIRPPRMVIFSASKNRIKIRRADGFRPNYITS